MKISAHDLARFEYLALKFENQFRGELPSQRVSAELGSGLEFVDHRNYFPGDDHRNIDWNIYARLGDLMVKRYREDRNVPVSILLDCSLSMESNAKFDLAREITAALSYLVLKPFDSLSILPFSTKPLPSLTKLQGKSQIVNVISFLKSLACCGQETNLVLAVESMVQQPRHAGPVFVISDFLVPESQQWSNALQRLKFHHHDPFVIQMKESLPSDLNLESLNDESECELIDRETGQSLRTMINPAKLKQIQQRQTAHALSIQHFCRQNRIGYFLAEPTWTYEQIVLKLLDSF